jgi:TPP-dependent pyruvate/acetoin dehydrogenase alpha subunit
MTTPVATADDVDAALAMYETMVAIRRFDEASYDLFLRGLVHGSIHLSSGQEAIAVGFASAQRPTDLTYCTYRGHSHAIARGVPVAPILGEMMGRAGGLMGGKGGSMHITDPSHGLMGSYAIVGAHLPIAAGAAWAAQVRGTDQVVVCFFGDGATNIGAFHEALNIAAVWRLPIVYVCENNQYMEFTPIRSVTAVDRPAADRAVAYGLERIVIDGNDLDIVRSTAVDAIARARSGAGPVLIEADTYRHGGHSRADPGTYRPAEEIAAWMARDPLPLQRGRLLGRGVEEVRIAAAEAAVKERIEAAAAEATAMPEPDAASATAGLWSEGGAAWRS